MNITLEKMNGTSLLQINEERIDAHNSQQLKDAILRQLEQGDTQLIVELKKVRFIDSSGLGALLSGHKNAVLKSGTLKLVQMQPQVQSMFELTRLNRVFEIYANADEALALAH